MKVYYTATSPFARKVLMAAHELGVTLETVFLRPSPLTPDPVLSAQNPLSKIPALVLDDGATLYDSPVICEYLDVRFGPKLIPAAGPERWRVLRGQALCDGILDAGVLVFYEKGQRPPEAQFAPWIAGQTGKVMQGLDALERELEGFGTAVDLVHLAAGATVGWLDFRNVVGDWRVGRPKLAAWYEAFVQHPAMQATLPRA